MQPVFRKYSNNQRFYKVLDQERFHEIQIVGNKYQQFLVQAKSYPEKLFIQDLINLSFDGVEALTEEQFNSEILEVKSIREEIKPHQN